MLTVYGTLCKVIFFIGLKVVAPLCLELQWARKPSAFQEIHRLFSSKWGGFVLQEGVPKVPRIPRTEPTGKSGCDGSLDHSPVAPIPGGTPHNVGQVGAYEGGHHEVEGATLQGLNVKVMIDQPRDHDDRHHVSSC